MEEIILTKEQKNILREHAEDSGANESCAILFGRTDGSKTKVSEIYLAENIEKSPVSFTISNEQLIDAYKKSEQKKLDVIGIFHSHPESDAYPSSTDRKFMYNNPVVWVIYSGSAKEFRAFRLDSDIREVKITS